MHGSTRRICQRRGGNALIQSGAPAGSLPESVDLPLPPPLPVQPPRPLRRSYDPRDALPPGVLLTRDNEAALVAAYIAQGTPLTPAEGVAIAGPSPPYPTGLPRFIDSNPTPQGWAIDAPGRDEACG